MTETVIMRTSYKGWERKCSGCGEWVPADSETQQFIVHHECGWITQMRKAARFDEMEARVRELEAEVWRLQFWQEKAVNLYPDLERLE